LIIFIRSFTALKIQANDRVNIAITVDEVAWGELGDAQILVAL